MNTYELCTDLDKNADSYSLNLGLCLKCLAFVTSSPGDTDTVFNFYVRLLILERETLICCFRLLTHSLIASCMCPDQGLNLQLWFIRMTL